ncbi:PREDICTED: LOW QUALITY PROTEIN: serum amyloid A-4 protein-like [Ceratotherium simum simum]|uniref:Serum amyloid A protein n=1 Tax=Ceratotherium simum simum TaxID=73337 RepID=A0ABM1CS97_CERSS|nr:PREDICTED: LOW QUALITY PROTEIN: serum amyloid A-4 protein-like [Ceratotherium simum simum]
MKWKVRRADPKQGAARVTLREMDQNHEQLTAVAVAGEGEGGGSEAAQKSIRYPTPRCLSKAWSGLDTKVHFGYFVSFPGTWDLLGAYWDMREANYQHSARYFHAGGSYDAAQRGPGGVWAAKVISNVREYLQGLLNQDYFGSSSYGLRDLKSNQKAEEWGRSGNDPEHFRPAGLAEKYRAPSSLCCHGTRL